MACFSVFLKSTNKQIRVFSYNLLDKKDQSRSYKLAIDFARINHNSGHPCTIEQYTISDTWGYHVFDSELDSGLPVR